MLASLAGSRNFFGVTFFSIMFLAMGSMPQMAVTMASKRWDPRHSETLN